MFVLFYYLLASSRKKRCTLALVATPCESPLFLNLRPSLDPERVEDPMPPNSLLFVRFR